MKLYFLDKMQNSIANSHKYKMDKLLKQESSKKIDKPKVPIKKNKPKLNGIFISINIKFINF